MLPPGLRSAREVTLYYDSLYDSMIDSGEAHPFLYPWAGIGAFLVLGYLLVDHHRSSTLRWTRYPLFALFFAFQAWVIFTNRARHPAGALGVGLLSSWGIMWVSTVMVINDCQTDFVRIERTDDMVVKGGPARNGPIPNGTPSRSTAAGLKPTALNASKVNASGTLQWQAYPLAFSDRLDWIADVFCSFRGVGWNWQTTTVPPLPTSIKAQLEETADTATVEELTTSRTGIRRFSDRAALLKGVFVNLLTGYIALDIIKVLMTHDDYFWGYMDATPPSYLPTLVQNSYVLVKSYRLLISLAAMHTALWEIFKLGPLFFCGVLGPDWIGVRGEPYMNPADMFGAFHNILDNGLAGWWGGWWHQTFRVALEAHSKWLLERLGIDKRSERGKLMSIFVAFFLSGCLHACGSITLLGDTRPLMGPMRFFLLQPFGILLQTFLARQLSRAGILDGTPKLIRQVVNFVLVHTWLYHTAPLLVDDFAKGGVWLFEPVAISPLRGLGLGAQDDGWFCWWDGILSWRSGKHWWDTGIAL